MKLAAVIVTYNSSGCIGGCLEACLRFQHEFAAGIVVVDNASPDGTSDIAGRYAGVRVVANNSNRGFAGAANQGFSLVEGADAVLLLNPDAVLLSPPSLLASELESDARLAAVGGQLLDESGVPQGGFQVRRFPTAAALAFEVLGVNRLLPGNPVNRRYRALDLDPGRNAENIQPAGACLLIRRTAWHAAGGFDEGFYPLWFEEVDLLQRLRGEGWTTRYICAFSARHAGAHSVRSLSWASRQLYWYSSLLRYASLYFQDRKRILICGAVILGILPRMVTGMFLQRSIRPFGVGLKVIGLAITYLWTGSALSIRSEMATMSSPVECEPAGALKRPGSLV